MSLCLTSSGDGSPELVMFVVTISLGSQPVTFINGTPIPSLLSSLSVDVPIISPVICCNG